MSLNTTPVSPNGNGNGKLLETTVYIWNMSEDVWPFICAITDDRMRQTEISENAALGDRELFSLAGEDDFIFVLPRPVSEEFLQYYTSLFGKKRFTILVPKRHTGVICDDIRADKQVLQTLIDAGLKSKRLMISSYSTSQQLLRLVETIRAGGVDVITPEAPEEEDAWTINFYGSKSGIRQLAQKSVAAEPDFQMAEGLICVNVADAAKIAANKYIHENGVVIKTNKGHSGAGILIFRPGDLPLQYKECEARIFKRLQEEAYWDKFPIIIEDYIPVNPAIGGGSLSVEFQIHKSGRIDFLYYCGMRVDRDGVFGGVEISYGIFSDRIAATLVDTGFFIAEQYVKAGYRGYFDVDFVVAKNGKLVVTESNVRRTGGTYVYAVAEHLLGKDFMYQWYVLSVTTYELPKGAFRSFNALLDRLKPVLYDKKTKEGVLVISENMVMQDKLVYIIISRQKKHALELQEKLHTLIWQ